MPCTNEIILTTNRIQHLELRAGKPRAKAVIRTIVPINPRSVHMGDERYARPSGSWTTNVYEGGKYIGEWLNLQHEHCYSKEEQEDYDRAFGALVRFKPAGANWDWW